MAKKDRTIFNEIQDVKRLITDHRATLYRMEETENLARNRGDSDKDIVEKYANLTSDRRIMIKALELYLASLEQTVQAHERIEKRKTADE